MTAILQTRALNKTYTTTDQSPPVIRNLDLDIERESFTVIMGNSGSGKSSLLYLLSGLDKPSSGEVFLNGQALSGLNETTCAKLRRDTVGFIFQDFNLIPNLSFLENILVAGYLGSQARKAVRMRAMELLDLVGIAHLAQRLPSHTSGGEQQRCAIARALINKPKVVLADEPTGNLNSANSSSVLDVFATLHSQGQTLIMVTHDLRTACRGDRVLFMRDGQIHDSHVFSKDAFTSLAQREAHLFQWLSERGW